jgi:methionyl-tRNA formyltransferase
MIKRVAVFGDDAGIPQLLKFLPAEHVSCLVAASIRPQGHAPIHDLAASHGLSVLIQPKVKGPDYPRFVQELREFKPDMILCNSYSMLIRKDVRDLVDPHALNVHGSLLPRNRGCNPIQWALIHGDETCGVTLHRMDDVFDQGEIVAQRSFPILEEDTWLDLGSRLAAQTDRLLEEQVPVLLTGTYPCAVQAALEASSNPRLNADSPRIDFDQMSDRDIYNLIRAQVAPLAGAYLERRGERIRFPEKCSMREVCELRIKYANV